MIALVIPAAPEHPMRYVRIDQRDELRALQTIVGGNIEAVPLPEFVDRDERATAYVHEEGKFVQPCVPNMRATDYMVPGVGLFMGDYIAGAFVLMGFRPSTGTHTPEPPPPVVDRARLIEREATSRDLPRVADADVVDVETLIAEWEATPDA
jgi:hypothetical protein